MVLIAKNNRLGQKLSSKKWLICSTAVGIIFLIVPFLFIFNDPIFMLAKYQLRLDNGTLLNGLLTEQLEGPKIEIYLFNVTNGERFLSGEDEKVKLEEIGPFVYQEYRILEGLEINKDPGVMRYTPKLWTEFLANESYGDPKDVYLTMANIPMLAGTSIISDYPFFVKQLYNLMSAGYKSKPFIKKSVHEYLWGYPDPWIKLANTVVPGLIYYNSTGLLERLFDPNADYKLELGTSDAEKFQVKKVNRFQKDKKEKNQDLVETVQYFKDAYEGAVFPPQMTPEMPINIYRHSICKVFQLQYNGTRKMEYGSDAFVYTLHNNTMNEHTLCDSTGWCPDGILNLSPCFYDFPFAITKGHFLDADPRLMEKIEGVKPNRTIHESVLIADPKLGVTVGSRLSAMLSVSLKDTSFKKELKRLKDMFFPICHAVMRHPALREEAKGELRLMYIYGPYILISVEVLLIVLGLILVGRSAKITYWMWVAERKMVFDTLPTGQKLASAQMPLIKS